MRWVAVVFTAALVVSGCGDGGEETSGAPAPDAADVEVGDLAGVEIDVRRDPG